MLVPRATPKGTSVASLLLLQSGWSSHVVLGPFLADLEGVPAARREGGDQVSAALFFVAAAGLLGVLGVHGAHRAPIQPLSRCATRRFRNLLLLSAGLEKLTNDLILGQSCVMLQ